MTLPKTGAAELAASQDNSEVVVNAALRALDAGANRAIIVDRDLTAPPGSCTDGANYLVAASPTGAWSGQAGKMATAVGANAANGWAFQTIAVEGYRIYVADENVELQHDGAGWVPPGYVKSVVAAISGTNHDMLAADDTHYLRFTNASAKTLTVQPDGDEALADYFELHVRNVGAGDLTITEGSGVVVNPPFGGTLVVPQYGTVTLKRVAEDEFDLMGVTVPL